MELTVDTVVRFYLNIGYTSGRDETFTLGDLGFTDAELQELTELELDRSLSQMQEEWTWNYLDSGYHFE